MNRYVLPIKVFFILISSVLLSGCNFPFIGGTNYSGLKIDSQPLANIYVDDKHIGQSGTYDEKISPGEHVVKLISQSNPDQTWETRLTLKPNTTTVVNYTFGASPQESSSYIIEVEKIASKDKSEISVISTPPNAVVQVNDQSKGFAPLLQHGVNPGTHKVTVSSQGYTPINVVVEATSGYRQIVTVELGKLFALQPQVEPDQEINAALTEATPAASPADSPPPSPSPIATASPLPTPIAASTTPLNKPYVEINTTPTGWLRVRSEPNGLVDNEVARVDSGTTHPFIESNDAGWYKIEYETGKQGWIASQYATLVR